MLPAPKACAGEVQKIRNKERNKRRLEDQLMAETAMLGDVAVVRSIADLTEENDESRWLDVCSTSLTRCLDPHTSTLREPSRHQLKLLLRNSQLLIVKPGPG